MNRIYLIFLFSLYLLSCCNLDSSSSANNKGNKANQTLTPSDSKNKINSIKDSLSKLLKNDYRKLHQKSLSKESYENWLKKHQNTTRLAYIEALSNHYRSFPNDAESANCLFEVHHTFALTGNIPIALEYGDTLLSKYPNFNRRKELLFNQALLCDQIENPRDTPRLKKYLNVLLSEKTLDEKLRVQVKNWLDHAEMPLKSRVN